MMVVLGSRRCYGNEESCGNDEKKLSSTAAEAACEGVRRDDSHEFGLRDV